MDRCSLIFDYAPEICIEAGAGRMSIRKAPRAAFGLELQPAGRTRQKLADMLGQHLGKRFGPMQVRFPLFQRVLLRMSMLMFDVNGKGVVVALARHGAPADKPEHKREWDILVDPFERSVPQKAKVELDDERGYESELLLVSSEIHVLLKKTPGVTSLRWFFKGWDANKPGVRTPEELPWNMN